MIMTVSQVDSLTDEDVEKLFCPQVYFSDEGYGSYTHFRMLKDKSVSSVKRTAIMGHLRVLKFV